MDADELRELAALGFEVGAHTNRHVDLAAATAEDAYAEMGSCKQALEDLLDQPVETFAYPFCRYSAACPGAAERAGYLAAFTCSRPRRAPAVRAPPGDDGPLRRPRRVGAEVPPALSRDARVGARPPRARRAPRPSLKPRPQRELRAAKGFRDNASEALCGTFFEPCKEAVST